MRRKRRFRWLFRLIALCMILLLAGLGYYGFHMAQDVKRIKAYENEVSEAAEAYGISDYKNIIYGIIITESKGKSTDMMQSSESVYGERGLIDSPEESIQYGVDYLAQAIQLAKDNDCDIWTAVQAYNFGLDYVTYVKEHGGKNSRELAESYSRDVLSPLLGNESKTTYRYWRPESLLYNGGYLYHNGGNMFYADVVKFNGSMYEWMAGFV